jgi:prolyl oligopeptidase
MTAASDPGAEPLAYPPTETVDVVDTWASLREGRVSVADPYRWLEGDMREQPAVAAWVAAQNRLTRSVLDRLPGRERIAARLETLFDYARYGLPVKRGGRYFFSVQDGQQDQPVFQLLERLDGEPRVLIDPNAWSEDGTVALAGAAPSPDGRLLAYLVQDGGSDWRRIAVLDVDSGEALADRIAWVKFSGLSWARDSSGFYYSRYPEPTADAVFTAPNLHQAVYFHRIGTDQAEDVRIAADPVQPEVGWNAEATDDGAYLVLSTWKGTDGGGIRVLPLASAEEQPITVFDGFANNHAYVGNRGTRFLFRTDLEAPKGRIVEVDLAEPERLREVVAEGDAPIEGASWVGGHLLVSRLVDVTTEVTCYSAEFTALRRVPLPGLGTASGFGGDAEDPETFFAFTSFDRPTTLYRLDVATGETRLFRAPEIDFDPEAYVVEQLFVPSTGGARVPMFVVHRRDVVADPAAPPSALLYGYGGFGVSLTPSFSVTRLAWLELGGVLVVANLRGGGEYGRAWHDAGRLAHKQNVFDDFIAAAQQLIDLGWASPATLAIQGGSNGGLLVGAVANQRPELFAAALPAVGVMDMLRFDRFTAGRFWVDDYGRPDDPAMFDVLRSYSPLHNIPDTDGYPAMLITTADTDDRVVPGHSFKFAAALQAAHGGPAPRLIRIETRAGHGAGTPVSKVIEETADLWAFAAFHTGLDLRDAPSPAIDGEAS